MQSFHILKELIRCSRSIPALSVQNVPFKAEDYINLNETLEPADLLRLFMFTKPMEC